MLKIQALQKTAIYLIFSLSGFSALVYEVLWTKHLSLTFGTTMIAVSIVAATFMAGLAIGSYLLGKFADNETNLLRIYAYLELGIAIFALLFPPTLKLVGYLHASLEHILPNLPGTNHAVQLILSALLLVPPTICMGGTFPLMCRFFARKKSGGQIGRLYAMNTLGATLGAFLAGYVLIPSIGLSATNMAAVLINLAIAAVSWHFSKTIGLTVAADVSRATRAEQAQLARANRPVLIGIALIGFFSLAYEILWTRVFLLFLGNTSYAFSLILSSYLIGIALGGAIYARKAHPDLDEKQTFVRLSVLMGLAILVTVPFYDQLAQVFQWAHEASAGNWWLLSLLSGLIVFSTICVPTIISGSLLPAAIAIIDPGKTRTGEGVGLVVLHNTIGAVLGCLVAGFCLIPWLGSQYAFQLLATLNILLGVALCLKFARSPFSHLRHPAKRLLNPITAACVLAPLLVILPPQWDQALMNSGVYVYAPKYTAGGGIKKVLESERILEVIEGIDATVAIHESNDGQMRFFTVNGKTDGGSGRDMATQVLIGQLPMLMHPAPEDVLVIGLGTGITLRGMSSHPTRSIKCVEISPEVVEASAYFTEANHNALDDPKVSLLVRDGRNLLLTQQAQYDVIVSEPSNPWQTGNSNLFTSEFYQLVASRLKQGGLFAQWIGIYDITPENLRIATNTLLQIFPQTLTFRTGSDLIILGSQEELKFDYLRLQQRMASVGVKETLSAIGIETPGDLIANHYLLGDKSLRKFSRGARINSDDLPILEYSARDNLGRKLLGSNQMQNMNALLDARKRMVLPLTNMGKDQRTIAISLRELGNDFVKAGRATEAQSFLRKALEVEKNDTSSSQISPVQPEDDGGLSSHQMSAVTSPTKQV